MKLDTKYDFIIANKWRKTEKGKQGFYQIIPTSDYVDYFKYLTDCKSSISKERKRVKMLLLKRKDYGK